MIDSSFVLELMGKEKTFVKNTAYTNCWILKNPNSSSACHNVIGKVFTWHQLNLNLFNSRKFWSPVALLLLFSNILFVETMHLFVWFQYLFSSLKTILRGCDQTAKVHCPQLQKNDVLILKGDPNNQFDKHAFTPQLKHWTNNGQIPIRQKNIHHLSILPRLSKFIYHLSIEAICPPFIHFRNISNHLSTIYPFS